MVRTRSGNTARNRSVSPTRQPDEEYPADGGEAGDAESKAGDAEIKAGDVDEGKERKYARMPFALCCVASLFPILFRLFMRHIPSISQYNDYTLVLQCAGFLEVLSPFAAAVYVYHECKPKAYMMRVSAALLWIAVVSIFENCYAINPEFSQLYTKEELVWGPTIVWQVLFAVALNVDAPHNAQLACFGVACIISLSSHYYCFNDINLQVSLFAVCAGAFTSCLSIVMYYRNESSFRTRIELCAAGLGLVLILLDLFEMAGSIPQLKCQWTQAAESDIDRLNTNYWRVGYLLARSIMCICMAVSAQAASNTE